MQSNEGTKDNRGSRQRSDDPCVLSVEFLNLCLPSESLAELIIFGNCDLSHCYSMTYFISWAGGRKNLAPAIYSHALNQLEAPESIQRSNKLAFSCVCNQFAILSNSAWHAQTRARGPAAIARQEAFVSLTQPLRRFPQRWSLTASLKDLPLICSRHVWRDVRAC